MNVLNRLTLRGLRLNRTRTLVTIVGVILSAAMFTAVTTFATSLQQALVRGSIDSNGNWQGALDNIPYTSAQKAAQDQEIASSFLIRHEGYALLEGCRNEDKPYLAIEALGDAALTSLPVHLTEGRLPETEKEIVVSQHISENGGVSFAVGDTLMLQVGRRMTEDGYSLWQNTSYFTETPEQLTDSQPRTYTVVGIIERPAFEPYSAPGYTVITRLTDSFLADDDTVSLYLIMRHPHRIYDFLPQLAKDSGCSDSVVSYNRNVLRMQGIGSSNYMDTLYSMVAILVLLIAVGSISLIYNAFAISVSERSRQFGMLSGVGATSRQIRHAVFFEAFTVGAIGIPLGVGAGIGGIGVTLYCLRDTLSQTGLLQDGQSLELMISLPAVLAAAALCLFTILLSAWIPARRASRLSAIDAIRQSADIQIRPRQVKTSSLSRRLFGFEGMLALKNFRRNRRRYRTTVFSLTISIVLFLTASSYTLYLTQGSQISMEETGCDLFLWIEGREQADQLLPSLSSLSGVTSASYYRDRSSPSWVPASLVEENLIPPDGKNLIQDGETAYLWPDETGNVPLSISLYALDDGEMRRYLQELNLRMEEYTDPEHPRAIILDHQRYTRDGRYVDGHLFRTQPEQLTLMSYTEEGTSRPTLTLEAACYTDVPPRGLSKYAIGFDQLQIIVSNAIFDIFDTQQEDTAGSNLVTICLDSSSPKKTEEEILKTLKEWDFSDGYSLYNYTSAAESQNSLLLVIHVFSYGFITLISLITVANVFNTISTNIHLRRREFAMLQSVGMTGRAFQRMMNFECLFYGFKALLYGFPLSAATTVLIYFAISNGVIMDFIVPWKSVLFCIACVFLIVFVSMLYSMAKIRKENLVDVLKTETN